MCGKVRYVSEKSARKALSDCRRRARHLKKRRETRTYRCPECGGWHLTSEPFDPFLSNYQEGA